jgi:hypothetical protein
VRTLFILASFLLAAVSSSAQVFISAQYNSRFINIKENHIRTFDYDDAKYLHGLELEVMKRFRNGGNLGFDFCYNRRTVNNWGPTLLQRSPHEAKYHDPYFNHGFGPPNYDSGYLNKDFNSRPEFSYLSL